jgi:hypothetical protein
MYLNILKPTLHSMRISSKIRNKTRSSTLSTFIQHTSEIPSQSNKARERNKRGTNKKGSGSNYPYLQIR